MQRKLRRLLAACICAALLTVPALAAEATIRADYVEIQGEGFVADTFCGVEALYNETGRTLFCNELIERFYSSVYGVTMYTNNGDMTVTSPAGYHFERTADPQPGDIAYASAEARERYGNHYAIVRAADRAAGTVTLFEQNWVWDGKAGVGRVIPYDGDCYDFYTMVSSEGRVAPASDDTAPLAPAESADGEAAASVTAPLLPGFSYGASNITGTPSSWAENYVQTADYFGITAQAEGTYQSSLTRAQFARLAANAARTLGLTEDVSDAVAAVQRLGLMQPNADGTFDTTSHVTREMAATVLLRMLRAYGGVVAGDPAVLSRYPDGASVADWAKDAVAVMTQYELMNGTAKGFEPQSEMTLEQCVTLLVRICQM